MNQGSKTDVGFRLGGFIRNGKTKLNKAINMTSQKVISSWDGKDNCHFLSHGRIRSCGRMGMLSKLEDVITICDDMKI